MGLAMANNLQRHLAAKKALSLLYTNRTMSRGQPLQSIGGIAVPGFNDLVAHSKIIFTMVCRFNEWTVSNGRSYTSRRDIKLIRVIGLQ